MSTPRHGDDAPGELDPTGVRALLSSLPDPGPMPEDLVARISTSLREEQRRREFAGSAPHTDVISLAAERHARRPVRTLAWLGSAAAVAVAATVAVSQLFGGGQSADTAAHYPAADGGSTASPGDAGGDAGVGGDGEAADDVGDAAEEGEDSAAGNEGTETAAGGAPPAASTSEGAVLSLLDPVTLTSDDISEELSTWSTEPSTGDAESDDRGAHDSCLALLPDQPAGATYGVGPGLLDGRRDVVAVVRMTPPPRQGWVLDAGCATGDGGVLLGPVTLP